MTSFTAQMVKILLMVQKSQGQPPFGWCAKTLVNNGRNYQPQLVQLVSRISDFFHQQSHLPGSLAPKRKIIFHQCFRCELLLLGAVAKPSQEGQQDLSGLLLSLQKQQKDAPCTKRHGWFFVSGEAAWKYELIRSVGEARGQWLSTIWAATTWPGLFGCIEGMA